MKPIDYVSDEDVATKPLIKIANAGGSVILHKRGGDAAMMWRSDRAWRKQNGLAGPAPLCHPTKRWTKGRIRHFRLDPRAAQAKAKHEALLAELFGLAGLSPSVGRRGPARQPRLKTQAREMARRKRRSAQ